MATETSSVDQMEILKAVPRILDTSEQFLERTAWIGGIEVVTETYKSTDRSIASAACVRLFGLHGFSRLTKSQGITGRVVRNAYESST